MITCILLSAGLSQRFGSPKALAQLNNKPIIEHLQHMLLETRTDEIIVVLGAYAEQIKPYLLNHKHVKFVYNKDYNFGQTSSFKAGLRAISDDVQGILLLPVDHPLIRPQTVDQIIECFLNDPSKIVLPAFEGRKGHPPLFPASLKREFLALDDQIGLNTIAHAHQKETVIFPVEDPGVTKSFNTPSELKVLQKQ